MNGQVHECRLMDKHVVVMHQDNVRVAYVMN
eukprot:COSAG02_NODE_25946_length_644_cov_76.785321_2_plen_30_part_01